MNRTELRTATAKYGKYLASTGKSTATISNYGRVLKYFADFVGSNGIDEIDTMTVDDFRSMICEKASVNTAKQYLVTLHAFFKWCEVKKLISGNPVAPGDIPKGEPIEYDLLSLEEIEQLRNELEQPLKNPTANKIKNRAIMSILFYSGVRNDELRSICPKDLDYENGVIKIRHGKGNKYREVPFPEQAQTAVKFYCENIRPTYLADNEVLFGNLRNVKEWSKLTTTAIYSLCKRYIEKVTGHTGIGAHDIRHAFASFVSYAGVPTRTISLAMGHSSERITEQRYISILDGSAAPKVINSIFA